MSFRAPLLVFICLVPCYGFIAELLGASLARRTVVVGAAHRTVVVEVEIAKPLGIILEELDAGGTCVAELAAGGNAEASGGVLETDDGALVGRINGLSPGAPHQDIDY